MNNYDPKSEYETRRTASKKVVALFSVVSFSLGMGAATLSFYVRNKINVQKGVGGLETAGVVSFDESDFENYTNATKSAPTAEDVLEIEKDIENNIDDNVDSASALLSQEEGKTEEGSELFYRTYRVKKGDMIGYIADTFRVTQDTIISVNDIHQSRLLQIGQYLKIPSMAGIAYTVRGTDETIGEIAKKYEVSADKCARVNMIDAGKTLVAGSTIFIPDAELDWATKQEINGDLFMKPLKSKYYLSSYYGWRSSPFSGKRSYHGGIDMACPLGTPIYASLAGKVTSAGFNNVYGNYVIITHHSGYKTLYGHMSAILVNVGNTVYTNTRIGKVGSTGMSTGPHLHFTVYKFGKTMNPLTLLK